MGGIIDKDWEFMAQIKGFFFDLDGTLVDTHEANYFAYREAINAVTSNIVGEELRESIMAGESSSVFLPKIVKGLETEGIADINRQKALLYPNYLHTSKLNDYLSVFLRQMSENYVTVLVTTAKQENARAVLEAHDLTKYFTFTIFGDDVTSMKPDPEAYLRALSLSELSPAEAIAFEDSEKGLKAANAAGIQVVHIRNFS